MRRRLIRELVFLLVRTAAKLDIHYAVALAKALTRAAHDETVQINVPRPLAQHLNDWSEPVQIQFANTPNGWQMHIRACEQQVAISETIRARAARQ